MTSPLAAFIDTSDPPFLRMHPEEITPRLKRLWQEEPPPPKIAAAILAFIHQHSTQWWISTLSVPVRWWIYATLSAPQRCDYHIALWALTGDLECVRYVLSIARGPRRASPEARASAAWAVDSLIHQSPAWRAAVEQILQEAA